MNQKWLNKKDNKKLIVFFNGWGMDEKIVSHLLFEDYDVLMFNDYRILEIDNYDFSKYIDKTLLAWSMGVFICSKFYDTFKNFDRFIAINGTQKPVDDNYGIPHIIYNLMVENFNELTCDKFVRKISTGDNLREYCTRPMQELKEELIAIRDYKIDKHLKFDKVIISKKDRIMPPKNQRNYWQSQEIIPIEIESVHNVFENYTKWSDLL